MGVPQDEWFTMEHPFKMDDLGVPPFRETSIYSLQPLEGKLKLYWLLDNQINQFRPGKILSVYDELSDSKAIQSQRHTWKNPI